MGFVGWRGHDITQLFVSESDFGRGTAATLLRAAETAMASEGTALAFLYCRVQHERGLRFYWKHGWTRRAVLEEMLDDRAGPQPVPVWRMENALARRDRV